MIAGLYLVGLATCLGCGWNVVAASARWQHDLAWILGGLIGAAMMALATWFTIGCPA